jgi:hypothetical protein
MTLNVSRLRGQWSFCVACLGALACAVDAEQQLPLSDNDDDMSTVEVPSAPVEAANPELRQTVIQTNRGPQTVTYEVRDGIGYYQGDIELGPVDGLPDPEEAGLRGNLALLNQTWPDGIVYYVKPSVTAAQNVAIEAAIKEWNDRTDLQFIQVPDFLYPRIKFVVDIYQQPYVASSPIGMQGGVQYIRLGILVTSKAVMLHEIGHAVGLFHEHTRLDRDDHININYGCLLANSGFERFHNFDKDVGVAPYAYDFKSIMHYDSTTFGSVSCPVITKKDGSLISSSSKLSAKDIDTVNWWY